MRQWGNRRDRDFPEEQLTQLGYSAQPSPPADEEAPDIDGGATLSIADHTFIVHTNSRHVVERAAFTRLLAGRLPFPGMEMAPVRMEARKPAVKRQ